MAAQAQKRAATAETEYARLSQEREVEGSS